METIEVNLGKRSYSIYIHQGFLTEPSTLNSETWSRYFHKKRLLIVSNDTIAPLYIEQVKAFFKPASSTDSVILPDGEQYKTLEYLNHIFDKLLQDNYGRDCVLIALGGGVVGDMTGFAAACYQRGIDFIQVPTTLLAQVDSSVGGKTAVNHVLGKNMLGAFHQPKAVFIDTEFLKSLPVREFNAGMAEVIKYGIIWDIEFFEWLEQNVEPLKQLEPAALIYAISRCCEIKADVVALDETERGCRALLNLGHTFGHAIEAEMGYGNWLHGEAVSAGMVLAAETSQQLGWVSFETVQRISRLISAFELPLAKPKSMSADAFIKHMQRDKKVLDQKIRLVLPTQIGEAVVTSEVSHQQLIDVLS
ncbi:3-dehydroquinate synthase [Shewanella sp. OPT22]|nr:3-dehydroquinate synthase [Shewanella sp. OPT22]